MEFTPIETQEDFDKAIKGRLDRQEKAIRGEYADYEDLKNQISGFAATEQGYKDQIAQLEKEKNLNAASAIRLKKAYEYRIPMEMADRLRGDTEEDIDADAKALAKMIGRKGPTPPLRNNEPPVEKDAKRAALRGMLAKMKEE